LDLLGGHAFRCRQILAQDCHSIVRAGFQIGQKRFGLAAQVIEVWARGKVRVHDLFSMRYAWIRKQAARRTCKESIRIKVKLG
jgi:hypothetical protein